MKVALSWQSHDAQKPLSRRERGWGEGVAKAANSGKNGLGGQTHALFSRFRCLHRTLIRPCGPPSPEGRRVYPHHAITPSASWCLAVLLLLSAQAHAQHHEHAGHGAPAACTPEHAAMGHCTLPPDTSANTPHTPIPPLTDADRAAAFPDLRTAHHHASPVHWLARLDHLDAWEHGQSWSADFRYGGDLHRLRLASDGERRRGTLESATWYAHYSRSITPWWDFLAGARHDVQPDSRTWASVGIQGLAPYFFELSALLHASSGGQVQFTLEAEYELLLTNRLILQPMAELTASLKNEPGRGIGSGLGTLETGLRLRYEITRRFAPYLGFVHERNFGHSADFARRDGHSPRESRVVAGIRVWF